MTKITDRVRNSKFDKFSGGLSKDYVVEIHKVLSSGGEIRIFSADSRRGAGIVFASDKWVTEFKIDSSGHLYVNLFSMIPYTDEYIAEFVKSALAGSLINYIAYNDGSFRKLRI